jgi:hypothetical protein
MNNSEIRSLYGLKYYPFLPDVPADALFTIPGTEPFALRVQTMAAQGGFLMTKELMRTLTAHAANNLRVLNQMAAELLAVTAQRNLPRIDESLFFELFSPTSPKSRRKQRA